MIIIENKGKLFRNIFIILSIILITYIIIVLNRWNILNKISKNQEKYRGKNNYYITYNYENQKEPTAFKYWRYGHIYKKQYDFGSSLPNNIFWYNEKTEEQYRYLEEDKTYEISDMAKVETNPKIYDINIPIEKSQNIDRLLYAINLTNSIQKDIYNGKECYIFKYDKDKIDLKAEYIDKETGLCIFREYDNAEKNYKIEYSFDSINEKDIEKPNFDEYSLKQ